MLIGILVGGVSSGKVARSREQIAERKMGDIVIRIGFRQLVEIFFGRFVIARVAREVSHTFEGITVLGLAIQDAGIHLACLVLAVGFP